MYQGKFDAFSFAQALAEMSKREEPFAVATVVRISGSSLGKPGFRIIVSKEGKVVFGTLGGVCPEGPIISVALETIKTGMPRVVKVYLEDTRSSIMGLAKSQDPDEIHVETYCGGMMEVYVEPFIPPSRLILIGQGGKDDVEDALIKLGKMVGLKVVVIDPLPVLSEKPDMLIDDPGYDISNFEFKESDYVVVLTKGARDVNILETLSKFNVKFVGLLASRKRVKHDVDKLKEKGVRDEFVNSLHAPVGVDIGATTPAEIALSIMADIIATKYGKHLPHKSMDIKEAI